MPKYLSNCKNFLSLPSKFQQLQRHFHIYIHFKQINPLILKSLCCNFTNNGNAYSEGQKQSAVFFYLLPANHFFWFLNSFYKYTAALCINIFCDCTKNDLSYCHLIKSFFASIFLLWKSLLLPYLQSHLEFFIWCIPRWLSQYANLA